MPTCNAKRRSCRLEVFCKKMFLKISPKGCNFIKKETPANVFSCEFGEIFKNTYSEGHLQTAASENKQPDVRKVKIRFAICVIGQDGNKVKMSRKS